MLPIASCSINWDKLLTLQLDVQYYNTCSLNVKLSVSEVKLQLSLSFLTAVSSWSGSRSHIIKRCQRRDRHENTLLCSGGTKLFWAERYNGVDDIFVMHWAGGLCREKLCLQSRLWPCTSLKNQGTVSQIDQPRPVNHFFYTKLLFPKCHCCTGNKHGISQLDLEI